LVRKNIHNIYKLNVTTLTVYYISFNLRYQQNNELYDLYIIYKLNVINREE